MPSLRDGIILQVKSFGWRAEVVDACIYAGCFAYYVETCCAMAESKSTIKDSTHNPPAPNHDTCKPRLVNDQD